MQTKLSQDEQSLLEINAEIQYQKKVNPLAYHESLPVQIEIENDSSKTIFGFGGNRSSKTETFAKKMVQRMLDEPLYKCWAVAETFNDSVNIQQRKIWNLIPKYKIKYGFWDDINGFPNRKLLLDNGSMCVFKSYDQRREAFQSDDIDMIWLDEEPPYDIYKECRMRLLDRNGYLFGSMTSLKGVTELIEDIYQDSDVIKAQHAPLVNDTLPRIAEKNGIRFYFLWTTENPYIDQSRVTEEIKLMTRQEVMSRIYGIPINLTGKIYNFNKNVHTCQWDDLPKQTSDEPSESDWCLWHVLDPHDRKPWAMIWVAIHSSGSIYVVDEYPFERNFNEMTFDDKTYDEYADVIKRKEEYLEEFFGPVKRRIIDPNFGNKTVQLAERQGKTAKKTPKKILRDLGLLYYDGIDSIEAGHLAVRQALHYEIKDKEIIVSPLLRVVDDCSNTVRHMSRYSRRDIEGADGDVKDKVSPQDKYKDFPDCVRYLMMANPHFIYEKKLRIDNKRIY